MFRLDGKTALVTGSATGLGRGIALGLAGQGARVVLSDLPGVSLEESREAIRAQAGAEAAGFALDVRDPAQIDRALAEIAAAVGRIDILVNNAGINRPKPVLEIDPETWDEHYRVNVRGGFLLAQKLAPAMAQAGWGRIVWLASQSGLIGIPAQPAYASSKGAVVQLVRSLGGAWAKQGVTVNAIAPTMVETNFTRKRLQDPEFRGMVERRIPTGRIATVEDVAAAAVFLASDEAGMVNCHTLTVDGGWTACLF